MDRGKGFDRLGASKDQTPIRCLKNTTWNASEKESP